MAAILQALYFSGSRLSTGEPNDSGLVYAYVIGTLTPATLYADEDATIAITQPITLDSGGRVPFADYPDGVWITSPVRLIVQDVDGTTVSDAPVWPADARDTALDNDGFTVATVDAALSALYASLGGQDAKYLESGGATARTIKSKFQEIHISPKDFGAVGDGVAIDTTPLQTAMNRIVALGGGILDLGAASYRIDQAITASSTDGITIKGAGSEGTSIICTNGTANCFTFTSCGSLRIGGFTIEHATESTGDAFSLTTCSSPTFEDLVHTGGASSGFRRCVALSSSGTSVLRNCSFTTETTSAAARGLFANSSSVLMIGGSLSSTTGYAFEADGTTGSCVFVGATIAVTTRFAATLTSSGFVFVGCTLSTISVATATIPGIRLIASAPFGYSDSAATGGSITPNLVGGNILTFTGTASGAGTITINNPSLLPASAVGQFWEFLLVNSTGNNVTWSFGAAYRLNGAVSNTTGQTTAIRFYCDGTTIRETSFRATTTT